MPESTARLLVIVDEAAVLEVVTHLARPLGFEVLAFPDSHEALAELGRLHPDLVFVDLELPAVGGLSVLQEIKRRAPNSEVVLLTRDPTAAGAVEAIKLGATDHIGQPLAANRLEELLKMIHGEVARRRELADIEHNLLAHVRFEGMVGKSPGMLELFSLIRRVAPHFTTALVIGEAGAGKELVARALHTRSRLDGRFVMVNCANLQDGFLESELDAGGAGTVVLDEVGGLSVQMQDKVMSAIGDERADTRGFTRSHRVIATTSRTLDRDVETGRFRGDLYHQLTDVQLSVPPLRDRREDIPLLVRAFIDEYSHQLGKSIRGATVRTEQRLITHTWPGNVRELKGALERACTLAQGPYIDEADVILEPLKAGVVLTGMPHAPVRPIAVLEREEIVRALDETRGNKNQAARRLGISRRALYRRLEKFGLETPPGTTVSRPPA